VDVGDLDLLRRYEPVVRYTQGEMFFPSAVDGYVERCSLWARAAGRRLELLVPAGELTVDRLARAAAEHPGLALSLRFVQEPLGGRELHRWSSARPSFKGGSRLARVGLIGRLADSVFTLSLWLRGKVPGGTTAAAQVQAAQIAAATPGCTYYGRVHRQDGYTVLNYHFFHMMNDWRSSFFGANDHEADWEQIFVYLVEDLDGGERAAWVAFAAHDYTGDDLRRRWDDPDLSWVGEHPVVFAGAGSHASYFLPGEYLAYVDLRPLRPLVVAAEGLRRFWRDILKQGDPQGLSEGAKQLVRVPFVDYARGDGLSVGPGQDVEWRPQVIDDSVDWVMGYNGLWGLDTEDVFAGETAPAGPRYMRDGRVRASWIDPVGWAGLGKVPTPLATQPELDARIAELKAESASTWDRVSRVRGAEAKLGLEVQALRTTSRMGHFAQTRTEELAAMEAEIAKLDGRGTELEASISALERYRNRLRQGYRTDPQAHIHHRQTPEPHERLRRGRIAELWAALTVGLLLVGAAGLIFAGATWTVIGALILAGVLVDSILRGTMVNFLLNATVVLAVITAGVLFYEFWWQTILAAIALLGVMLLVDNLREFRRR
jgi:hypothetical protein